MSANYEFDILVFSVDAQSLVARSYTDAPQEAHFIRIETGAEGRQLTEEDMKSTQLAEAVAYLRRNGKSQTNWLSGRGNGYDPIPSDVEMRPNPSFKRTHDGAA